MKRLYALICASVFWGMSNAGRDGYGGADSDTVLETASAFLEWLEDKK